MFFGRQLYVYRLCKVNYAIGTPLRSVLRLEAWQNFSVVPLSIALLLSTLPQDIKYDFKVRAVY